MDTKKVESPGWTLLIILIYLTAWFAAVIVGLWIGNTIGACLFIIGVSLAHSIGSRLFRIKDGVLCIVGTFVLFVGSFFYCGSEGRTHYLKNKEEKTTPFFAVPFYDHVVPVSTIAKGEKP